MADVKLIIQPSIDLAMFLGIANQYVGENIHARVAMSNRLLTSGAEALASLEAFVGNYGDGIVAVRTSRVGQVAFNYGFFVFCSLDAWHEINMLGLGLTQLYTSERGTALSLVLGNLQQWKDAVVLGTRSDNAEVRFVFNKVYLEFEKLGLAAIWSEFRRASKPDQTFYLQ